MDETRILWSKLRRLLRHRGRSREDVEDMVQDAFVRLQSYRKAAEVREREAFLVRTAINLEVDLQRRERHRTFAAEALEELPLLADSPAPDEMVAVQQRLQRMERALATVSPRAREVFWMNRVEGYSYTQVARVLSISVSAVEKYMTRALAAVTAQGARE